MIKIKTVSLNFDDGATARLSFLSDSKSNVYISVPYSEDESDEKYEADLTDKVIKILGLLKNVV